LIKYLLTEDSIFFPALKYTLSKESRYFNEIVEICKDEKSDLSQIQFLSPNFTYQNEDISIEHEGNNAEIYYNGKYYKFPENFLNTCTHLINERTSLTLQTIATFLTKCFKNYNYNFKDLFRILEEYGFNFLKNGNILVYKKYENGDERRLNMFYEERQVLITNFKSDKEKYTVIEIDPSEINNRIVFNYKIRDITCINYLVNTYLHNFLFNTIFSFLRVENRDETIFAKLNTLLSTQVEKILDLYKIQILEEFVFSDTLPDDIYLNYALSVALRLCQE
jgi:hypothetical protein